jgi:hypothetical protein
MPRGGRNDLIAEAKGPRAIFAASRRMAKQNDRQSEVGNRQFRTRKIS